MPHRRRRWGIVAALTASVLAGAAVAVPVGRWLDRHGDHAVPVLGVRYDAAAMTVHLVVFLVHSGPPVTFAAGLIAAVRSGTPTPLAVTDTAGSG